MNKKNILRYGILLSFLTIFIIFTIRHMILGGGVAPSIDALCPFGGFETLYTFLMTGNYVPRILISGLILAIGLIVSAVIFNRAFCGWLCPFGAIQELLGKITKKKYQLPEKIDKYARYTKYLVLAAILVGTAITGTLVFREYDPFITFFHYGEGVLWGEAETVGIPIAFIILIIVLALAVFVERAWCRYFCPLGATITLFSWFRLSKIERNQKTCIDCKLCDKTCPSRVNVSESKTVKDLECIDCIQCVDSCPKKSLGITIFGKQISKTVFALSFIALFFGMIGASMAFGAWQSTPSTEIKDNTGQVNVDNIRGWMPIGNVSISAGIPMEIIAKDFSFPLGVDQNTPLKEIATKYGVLFDTETFKEYVRTFDYTRLNTQVPTEPVCPWVIQDDHYPGQCGLYVDKDKNGVCDLS